MPDPLSWIDIFNREKRQLRHQVVGGGQSVTCFCIWINLKATMEKAGPI
jgi:hypothetical protein